VKNHSVTPVIQALTYDMKLIGKIELLDLAFLPIGGHFTMDVQEAAVAAQFINCGTIVGMHYDTFPPIQIDHSHAVNIFAATGKRLLLPGIGDTITL
jgi:L-ascorbate metabolism protein UlaG (beta-lactamase superfamily)